MKKPILLMLIVVVGYFYIDLGVSGYASDSFPDTSTPPKTAEKATFAGGL